MLSLNASSFYRAATTLSAMATLIESWSDTDFDSKSDIVAGGSRENFVVALGELARELTVLECRVTLMVVDRLIGGLGNSPSDLTYQSAAAGFNEIQSRLKDELSLSTVFALHSDKAKFYQAGPLAFGQTVADRLPIATPDIEDAGKCLALDQGTAAVFHLMRAMEAGLKELARILGIPYAPS